MTEYVDLSSQSDIDQGDIFKEIYFAALDTNVTAVIITPTCDLQNGKAHFVKFAGVVEAGIVMNAIADSVGIGLEYFDGTETLSGKQNKQITKLIDRNIDGSFLPRYYLLTRLNDELPPCYIDLQQIFVIPTMQVLGEYRANRIGRLKSPWREQLIAQYTGYAMRIGTPECPEVSITDLIESSGLNINQIET